MTKANEDTERRMLSFILSWVVIIHKLQGTTLNRDVIDLPKENFANSQVYVTLSHVISLNGLSVSNLVPNKILNKAHDEIVFVEMQRLLS